MFVPDATAAEFAGPDPPPDGLERGSVAVVTGDLGEGSSYPVPSRAFRLLMSDAAILLVALG